MYITRKTQTTLKLTALPAKNWLMGCFVILFVGFAFWGFMGSNSIQQSDRPLVALLVMGLFLLVGLGIILFSKIIILELDKNRNSLIMRSLGLFSRQQIDCKLSDIKQVTYMPTESLDRGRSSGYFIMIITKDDKEMPLNAVPSNWMRARKAADKLNEFLGIKQQ